MKREEKLSGEVYGGMCPRGEMSYTRIVGLIGALISGSLLTTFHCGVYIDNTYLFSGTAPTDGVDCGRRKSPTGSSDRS